jgi:hypothetical protein
MISIQVSVQQHTTTSIPSMIHAHIKLGRSSVSSPLAVSNTPLVDLICEPLGKIPFLVDPGFCSLALKHRLHALCGSKRTFDGDDELPPFKKARTLGFPLLPQCPVLTIPNANKVLRFANAHEPEIIPDSQHDYDCDARWYSRGEYNAFRQDMKMNFFMHSMYMRRNSLSQQEKHPGVQVRPPQDMCIRGLEKFCFHSNHEAVVKDTRKLRMQAVLDQQSVQRALGYKDPMAIRVVAELYSQKVIVQGLERAADDYRAVLYGWSRKSI